MIWLSCLCAAMMITIILLGIKIYLLRKAATEISEQFSEKLENDTNTLIILSTRDRAMRRLANEINIQLRELCKQRHRFQVGDVELKNAVTNISHDLRTPLTAICSYLDLLDGAEKSESVTRYIEVIRNRTELLIQLTEEMFSYSVLSTSNYNAGIEPVIINHALEESIAAFYITLREHNITPVIRITEQKIVHRLNPSALSRIFSNLLNNAIKYSDGDLEITMSDKGEIVFINTASGLDKVQVGKLFDRFYTVETARKSTGLGLSITKMLIEQIGGKITAKYIDHKLFILIEV